MIAEKLEKDSFSRIVQRPRALRLHVYQRRILYSSVSVQQTISPVRIPGASDVLKKKKRWKKNGNIFFNLSRSVSRTS